MVEPGPLGPVDPATGRHSNTPAAELLNYWAHGRGSEPLRKPAAERTYIYVQHWRYPWDVPELTEARKARYVVRVTEDRAGRRHVRTERYDPERGSGPNLKRVDLPELPNSIIIPMAVVFAMVMIIFGFMPIPIMIAANLALALFGWTKVYNRVERARMARFLRTADDDLPALHADERPPLLSEEELDARLLKLANPDEDRTFDDPAPIRLPSLLRDRAWKRWEDTYSERAVREAGRQYMSDPDTYFGEKPSAKTQALADRVQASCRTLRAYAGMVGENALRNEFAALDVERERVALMLGCEMRGIEHPRMFTAPPQLERSFTAKTDCADGHVGEHPIIASFVDRQGRQRITRACRWCLSEWSDLV